MAGATDFGIASRANLYLIKYENFLVNTLTGEKVTPGITSSAILEATCKILEAIGDEAPEGRSVFLMTSGL